MFEDANIARISRQEGGFILTTQCGRLESSTLSVGGSILLMCFLVSSWCTFLTLRIQTVLQLLFFLKVTASQTEASCNVSMFLQHMILRNSLLMAFPELDILACAQILLILGRKV